MREMSVAEQRYKAVLAVIADGRPVSEAAQAWGVSRQTLHAWLVRYEEGGLEGLADRSRRPGRSLHQMDAVVEVAVLEARRTHPRWGPRRIVFEINKVGLVASESGVYRAFCRAGLIEPGRRSRRVREWKRWERGEPNELWQFDVVGGFGLTDGSMLKCLTGVDDHSRFCISATLMRRERTQAVCDGLAASLRAHGVPQHILTDNGKVFTGRFHQPPVEVLFDRICRENGIEHLLTKPRSPTTTGKIERLHRSLRDEFLTGRILPSRRQAQAELDAWVDSYNRDRPHQSLGMDTPQQRYQPLTRREVAVIAQRTGPDWVTRKVSTVGVVCVSWQQVSVGRHRAGERCDIHVGEEVLQFWIGNDLLRTVARQSKGPVRNKRPLGGALSKTKQAD
ncbi:IS481 family transposase [Ornithinimicrobium sp. Arc0846-15]|nr:IS481 family transposase [Ornithinimicrobium laminariae]